MRKKQKQQNRGNSPGRVLDGGSDGQLQITEPDIPDGHRQDVKGRYRQIAEQINRV